MPYSHPAKLQHNFIPLEVRRENNHPISGKSWFDAIFFVVVVSSIFFHGKIGSRTGEAVITRPYVKKKIQL